MRKNTVEQRKFTTAALLKELAIQRMTLFAASRQARDAEQQRQRLKKEQ